jgi:hypothetical protein
MKRANVELHIEELVLHGLETGDRHRIAEAVQGELARLIGEQDIPPQLVRSGEIQRIDAGGFELAAGSREDALGSQIARSVYGGLGGK